MGFYNMQQGDVPYFKHLADKYTISDNYHQAGWAAPALNHILFGFGDAIWYSDGNGQRNGAPGQPDRESEPAAGHQ